MILGLRRRGLVVVDSMRRIRGRSRSRCRGRFLRGRVARLMLIRLCIRLLLLRDRKRIPLDAPMARERDHCRRRVRLLLMRRIHEVRLCGLIIPALAFDKDMIYFIERKFTRQMDMRTLAMKTTMTTTTKNKVTASLQISTPYPAPRQHPYDHTSLPLQNQYPPHLTNNSSQPPMPFTIPRLTDMPDASSRTGTTNPFVSAGPFIT